MSELNSRHDATVRWERAGQRFANNRYSRAHIWLFDGGARVRGSASPANVPAGTADPSAVDPEEAFVAAVASCHMLWFLSVAAARGLIIDRYADHAVGNIVPLAGAPGRKVLGRIVLRPTVSFAQSTPCTDVELVALHDEAHRQCYLANALGPSCTLVIERQAAGG